MITKDINTIKIARLGIHIYIHTIIRIQAPHDAQKHTARNTFVNSGKAMVIVTKIIVIISGN